MAVVASFTASTNAPIPREIVTFTDTSTGSPTAWAWDFGDGETSSEQHPEHAYAAPGVYPVTLTSGGSTAIATITVRRAVVLGTVELTDPAPFSRDRSPLVNATDVLDGVSLQGSARKKRAWTFSCMASSEDEIDALEALGVGRYDLNIDGTVYPGVMISSLVDQVGYPGRYPYTVGFRQEWIG